MTLHKDLTVQTYGTLYKDICSINPWYWIQRYDIKTYMLLCTSFDVDAHGERNVCLSDGVQQRAEVDQPVGSFVDDDLLKVLEVEEVRIVKATFIDCLHYQ